MFESLYYSCSGLLEALLMVYLLGQMLLISWLPKIAATACLRSLGSAKGLGARRQGCCCLDFSRCLDNAPRPEKASSGLYLERAVRAAANADWLRYGSNVGCSKT